MNIQQVIDSLRRFCLLLFLPGALGATTFTVTTTADSGAGSLRQAILDANASSGADLIDFDIPSPGVQTIAPETALPDITDTVTIDGYTQPGSSPNTLTIGDDAVILIELSAANVAFSLTVRPPGFGTSSVIRGLAIDHGAGVFFDYGGTTNNGQNRLIGCFVGVQPDGVTATPPSGVGLRSWSNVVGGTDPADRNVIGGAVNIESSKSNTVVNNYIGTDRSGTLALGVNGGVGVSTDSPYFATGNVISDNLVSGSTGVGIIVGGSGNRVLRNLVGTDVTGTLPLGNHQAGVIVSSFTGGSSGLNEVSDNTIAYSGGDGVQVFGNDGGGVLHRNSIHDNAGVGLLTPMHAPPAPTIETAVTVGDTTTIQATVSGPGLDVFANTSCDPSGFGEGRTPLTILSPGPQIEVERVAPGLFVTMTRTNLGTSSFSNCVLVTDGGPGPGIGSVSPGSGSPSGGTAVTVNGHGFQSGAAIEIGGSPAGASVLGPEQILLTAPALSPGTLNDVELTNPDSSTATLAKGWLADFLDVGASDPFHASIESIFRAGITAGCGGGMYCRNESVRRDQLAVLLLRAADGSSFAPPPCLGVFADTPCPGPYANWVEQLFTEGIAAGCGAGNYCPASPARRDQMAVFLLKAEHGEHFVPNPCAGIFADVTCPSTFADWIEQLAAEGITAGCGGGNYCPSDSSTRGQMAVFLTRTFPQP